MPGSSLWLLPPSDHPLNSILPTLISQTSNHFNSPHSFIPHVTLTSEISPSRYGPDPQAWLDSLELPEVGDVQIDFKELCSEDVFVRKLYIRCEKTEKLTKLGTMCRTAVEGFEDERKAEKWSKDVYDPHLSLL
jgi:2',3'-cyclic-nucleotide 3'-phosphodiesterase